MSDNVPYSKFGKRLKSLRAAASRTPAEVCSAVEIDETKLKSYESGEQRPSEDILMLLINHFGLSGELAEELWSLAGYKGKPTEDAYFGLPDESTPSIEHVAIGLTISDPRIIYTDMVQVMANDYGVIVNFMQGAGTGAQPLAVSRVGMSKEHARSVIALLQKTLLESEKPVHETKQLQEPSKSDPSNNSHK